MLIRKVKIVIILLAVGSVALGSFRIYKNISVSGAEIITSAVDSFVAASAVHADMEIVINVPEKDEASATTTKIKAVSDVNLAENSQNTHMVFEISGVSAEMDVISINNKEFYVKMPFLFSDWVKIGENELAQSENLPLDIKSQDYAAQTKAYLVSLDLNSLKKVGDENMDGKSVIHYKSDVNKTDFENYLKELSGNEALLDGFRNSQMEADLWVNRRENQIVRMEINVRDFEVKEPLTNEPLGKTNMTVNVKYSKFNQTVSVVKPEGKIISYQELFDQQGPFLPEVN
ncbi:hypothetical protein A2125_00155 [Candidatus Woesebacteria bacterium GWB1_43_5]|uniref:Uncharacterized protein n=1 Tax=Candidatus Woesebacteria bacterium GWB1_43_5 TaxID=1802474 RepID=A0A1F7WS81_9BACT|nr:MAG: hypothetical protein A2125_00155 [Candidatus Woesebacteria bacterium GWB1_43_5]